MFIPRFNAGEICRFRKKIGQRYAFFTCIDIINDSTGSVSTLQVIHEYELFWDCFFRIFTPDFKNTSDKNLRNIKKDVEFLVAELVDDCFIYLELNGEEKMDKVGEIIGDALDLQDDLMDKINHPNPEIQTDKYYKGVTKELVGGIDALYERLSALSAK